jgi:hypothetical protein
MTRKSFSIALLLTLLAFTATVVAQDNAAASIPPVPSLLKFSGAVVHAPGTVGVTFALYKDQAGGAPLWLETQNVAVNDSGQYTVYLGANHANGVPPELFAAGEARWLGVQAAGQAEQPRILLAAVPYAMKAVAADTLGGLPAASFVSSDTSGAGYQTLVQTIVEQMKESGTLTPLTATAGATNFSATTTDQVVSVTQTGTGKGINATTPSGQTIYAGNTATTGTVYAVYATAASPAAIPLRGVATSATGTTRGVQGNSASTSGEAGYFEATATSGTTYGVLGVTDSPSGYGIYGIGPVNGMKSIANNTTGVTTSFIGTVNSPSGIAAIFNNNAGGPLASFRNNGVQEIGFDASGDVTAAGVVTGKTLVSTVGAGTAPLTVTSTTVVPNLDASLLGGLASSAFAQLAAANTFTANQTVNANLIVTSAGVGATALAVQTTDGTAANTAISGVSNGPSGVGVYGQANNGSTGATPIGVWGYTSSTSAGALAGQFTGNVNVVGNLSKSGGSFKIDHPLDPANKYLYHSFVESPDMKNIYDGVVETDTNGEVVVVLPEYFQALNRDFRYQLTVIGQFAQAIVEHEIQDNRFVIKTDKPGVKVSWQVTGIRQDAWANAHRIPTEVEKPAEERGLYLHPQLYGAPEEKGIDWQRKTAMEKDGGSR